MKYANYDETNGKLLGWYDSDIHCTVTQEQLDEEGNIIVPYSIDTSNLPIPYLEVSEADWKMAIDNNYNFVDTTTNTLSFKDFRTFAELQSSKIASLTSDYDNANQLYIDYMDTTFQADKESQNLIVSVLSAGSVPDGFFWLDLLNNQVLMTYAELQGLSAAILARSQINFIKFQDLKAQVNLAVSIDELDIIAF